MGIMSDICREPNEDKLSQRPLRKDLGNLPKTNDQKEKIPEEDSKSVTSSVAVKQSEFSFFFDCFELTYKMIDNYGLVFQPKIIVNVENYLQYEIPVAEEKLKDITPENNRRKSVPNLALKNNKKYNFSDTFRFVIADLLDLNEDYFSSFIMNNLIITISIVNQKSLDLNGIPLVIGECKIPIHKLEENKVFETKLPIKNNLFKTVGYLYSRLLLSTEFLGYNSEKSVVSSKGKASSRGSYISSNTSKITTGKVDDNCGIMFNEYPCLPYMFLNPKLKDFFIIIPSEFVLGEDAFNTEYDKQINKLDLMENMKNEELLDFFIEALQENKQISSYEIFHYFIQLVQCSEEKTFESSFFYQFFKQLNNHDSRFKFVKMFPQIVSNNNNYSGVLIYFIFLYKLLAYFFKLEYLQGKLIEKSVLDVDYICILLIESFSLVEKLYYQYKDETGLDSVTSLNIAREIILFLLNSLYLIVYPTISETQDEFQSSLYIRSYNNGIKIIALSKYILSVFIYLKDDMEISNLTLKIFKKCIQLGIDWENKHLGRNEQKRIVANNIRILLVLDVKNSHFLTFLSICLLNLKHFPENYITVLNIFNQLSIDTSKHKILLNLYRSISIEGLISSFDLYRFNLKHISKQINYQYYSFIYHLTHLLFNLQDNIELSEDEESSLCGEMNLLFKIREINGSLNKPKKLDNFLKEIPYELKIILINITVNLTSNKVSCFDICRGDSYLLIYIINIIYELDKEKLIKEIENKLEKSQDNSKLIFNFFQRSLVVLDNLLTINPQYFLRLVNILNIDINKLKERIIDQKTIFAEGKMNKRNEISKDLIDRIFNKLTQSFIK
jgi:hypothetical protein